jgi:hypothetical protein
VVLPDEIVVAPDAVVAQDATVIPPSSHAEDAAA